MVLRWIDFRYLILPFFPNMKGWILLLLYRLFDKIDDELLMSIMCGSGSQEEEEDEPNPHHFALNFDYYTHFTSPIRRYPDVMVHRVLHCLLENQLKPRENEAVAADDDEEEVPTGPCYFQTRDSGFKRLKALGVWFHVRNPGGWKCLGKWVKSLTIHRSPSTWEMFPSFKMLIWRFRFTEEMKRKTKWRFAMSRSLILAGVKNSWIVLSFAFSFDPWNNGFTPSVPCCNWTIPLGMVMECRYIALSWVEKAKWPSDHKKRKVMKGMRTRWSFSWISPRKWRGVFCFVVWKIWIYAGWHSLDEKIVYHPAKTRLLVMDSKYKSSRLITILVEVSHIV